MSRRIFNEAASLSTPEWSLLLLLEEEVFSPLYSTIPHRIIQLCSEAVMQFDGLERVMYVFSWIFSEGVVSSLFFGCCLFCGMVLLKVVWCVKIIYFREVGWGGVGLEGMVL